MFDHDIFHLVYVTDQSAMEPGRSHGTIDYAHSLEGAITCIRHDVLDRGLFLWCGELGRVDQGFRLHWIVLPYVRQLRLDIQRFLLPVILWLVISTTL
jgi:hypothetical protein